MADIKPPTIPLAIPTPAYLADHRAEGRSILPAVEALQYLARAVREAKPEIEVWRSRLAEFVKVAATALKGVTAAASAVAPRVLTMNS